MEGLLEGFMMASPILLDGAALNDDPQSMTMVEIQKSMVLAIADIVLFFLTGLVAAKFYLDAVGRVAERRGLGAKDAEPLVRRQLLLKLLCLSNVLRSLGVLVAIQFHVAVYKGHHRKHDFPWHLWLDYLLSSLPTFVWCSMLSVLLLFFTEVDYRACMRWSPLLRPTLQFLNFVCYLCYGAVAFITFEFAAYHMFRQVTYALLCVIQGALGITLACRGFLLIRRLRNRRATALLEAGGGQPSLIPAICVLSTLIPFTELTRCVFDFLYVAHLDAHALLPKVKSKEKVYIIAAEKILLEWLPSVALLYSFRPKRQRFPLDKSVGPYSIAAHETVSPSPCRGGGIIDPLLSMDALRLPM
eukprot:TRINITY_DN13035_c0_g1_i4.p1 TRINITY_DN13035_c0_g1~~TRINITY_DN13035_c0_g1_i4.p1  ORF type:complete len:358 (+),score=49.17 TRINITY_DN13035_c0_g1_i4:88-1161(+)